MSNLLRLFFGAALVVALASAVTTTYVVSETAKIAAQTETPTDTHTPAPQPSGAHASPPPQSECPEGTHSISGPGSECVINMDRANQGQPPEGCQSPEGGCQNAYWDPGKCQCIPNGPPQGGNQGDGQHGGNQQQPGGNDGQNWDEQQLRQMKDEVKRFEKDWKKRQKQIAKDFKGATMPQEMTEKIAELEKLIASVKAATSGDALGDIDGRTLWDMLREIDESANAVRMVREQKQNLTREVKELPRMLQWGGRKSPAVKSLLAAKKAEVAALQKDAAAASTEEEVEAIRDRINTFRESWNSMQSYLGFQEFLGERVTQLEKFVQRTLKRLGSDVDTSAVTSALDRLKGYKQTMEAAFKSGDFDALDQLSSEEIEEAVQDVEQQVQSLQFLADRKKMMPQMVSFVNQYKKALTRQTSTLNASMKKIENRLARLADDDERRVDLEEELSDVQAKTEELKDVGPQIDSLDELLKEVSAAKSEDELGEEVFSEVMESNMQLAQTLNVKGFMLFAQKMMQNQGYKGGEYSGKQFGPRDMGPGGPGDHGDFRGGPGGPGDSRGGPGGQGDFRGDDQGGNFERQGGGGGGYRGGSNYNGPPMTESR